MELLMLNNFFDTTRVTNFLQTTSEDLLRKSRDAATQCIGKNDNSSDGSSVEPVQQHKLKNLWNAMMHWDLISVELWMLVSQRGGSWLRGDGGGSAGKGVTELLRIQQRTGEQSSRLGGLFGLER